jgi:hypothetical protein
MTPVDYFLDSLIIILPFFASITLANLPWTDKEIKETSNFWFRNT